MNGAGRSGRMNGAGPSGQMSGAGDARETREDDGTVSPWRGTTPELLIAAALVLAVAVAGYAVAGWAGLSVVAVSTVAIAMVVVRVLLPQATPDRARKAREKAQARTLSGYSHRRFVVQTSTSSLGFYQGERHGVHLTRTARPPAGCCAAAVVTPTCGRGSTQRGGRRPSRATPASGGVFPGAPWLASSTDWRSFDRPHPDDPTDRPAVHGHPGRARAGGRGPPPDPGTGADRHPWPAATCC